MAKANIHFSSLAFSQERIWFIFLNRVRQKQSVYDALLPCGWLTLYGHLHLAYACGTRVQIFCGVYGVGMFFFFLAFFPLFLSVPTRWRGQKQLKPNGILNFRIPNSFEKSTFGLA